MAPMIAEELLVLAYHPDGMVHGGGIELDCALAGALLLELAIDGAIDARDGRLHAVPDADAPSHPALASALASIVAEPGQAAHTWVLALTAGLRRRLLDELVARGVLADDVQRRLGVFARHRFPERDPSIRVDAKRRLRATSRAGSAPDARTAALATMVTAAGLGEQVWSGAQQRAAQHGLDDIDSAEWASDAVARAVRTAYARTMTV